VKPARLLIYMNTFSPACFIMCVCQLLVDFHIFLFSIFAGSRCSWHIFGAESSHGGQRKLPEVGTYIRSCSSMLMIVTDGIWWFAISH
jgi:hypothetical protein